MQFSNRFKPRPKPAPIDESKFKIIKLPANGPGSAPMEGWLYGKEKAAQKAIEEARFQGPKGRQ